MCGGGSGWGGGLSVQRFYTTVEGGGGIVFSF